MSDGSYISNPESHTVHRGTRDTGPECGTQIQREVATVDADTDEEAVMRYDLNPCSKCIDEDYKLSQWRADVHSATVVHGVSAPERWQR